MPRQAAPVSDHAYNTVLHLLREEVAVGDRLPIQTVLARRCEASRTTIHHLLGSLTRAGLVSAGRKPELLRLPAKKDFRPEPANLSRREEAEQSIMAMLVDGRLKPGQRFAELALARAQGVTTGTIREALLRLSTLGVLTKSARKQWQVAAIDEGMLQDIMDLRVQFECFALARFFDRRVSPKPFVALLAEMRKLGGQRTIPRGDFFRLDATLHRTILESGQNRYLGEQLQFLSFPLQLQSLHQSFGQKLLRKGLMEHLGLLRAIVSGRRGLALKRLRQHLDTARGTILSFTAAPRRLN